MSKAKNILITIGASVAVGAVLGMLYAPVEGAETRRKIRKLKHNLAHRLDGMDEDKETLQDLSSALQKELDKINAKLEHIG